MAPFLTHLVIGERVWNARDGGLGEGVYGTFLFGCLAPDVDKFCAGLEQAVTHFLPKDSGSTWIWHRTQHFLDCQGEFLRAPFARLEVNEQAFVLGYLCHVAVDEVAGRYGVTMQEHMPALLRPLPCVDAFLTAMDQAVWPTARQPAWVAASLAEAVIHPGTLPFVPDGCLAAMHQIVLPQVREGASLASYVRMVRRQRSWLRHGRVSNATDDAELERELADYYRQITEAMPVAQALLATIDPGLFVEEAADHSHQRIDTLLAMAQEEVS